MSTNQNGLLPSRDVASNGDSNSNFFLKKEDPLIVDNLIATSVTTDTINLNGGVLTTTAGGTVLELNGIPVGTGGEVDEIVGNLPIVVTGTPAVPILSIQASGVTSGTYNLATINVNPQGIITSASNGTIPANDDWSNFPAETNVNMANFLINNLGTPLVATDASTKGYVDTLDAQNVKITGAQNISGVKTFTTDLPQSIIVPTLPVQLVNKAYVDGALPGADPLSIVLAVGNSAGTNQINMNSNKIINCLDPTLAQDVATKNYVDTRPTETLANTLLAGNSAGASQINMNDNKIVNCLNPTDPQDVATKDYCDTVSVTPTLSAVLTAGNTANADINMNGFDISAVNDITMSGLVPTITATNIAGNLTITSASSMNLGTAGLLQVASGGILSLGGVTYTTVENLNINNSAITKQGAVADITFDNLASINTTSTTTPLTIGCGVDISTQPNEYEIGLVINNLNNSGPTATGIFVKATESGSIGSGIDIEGVTGRDISNGVRVNNIYTREGIANGINVDTVTSDGPGTVYGINMNEITNTGTGTATFIYCNESSTQAGDVFGIQMNAVLANEPNGQTATGILINSVKGMTKTKGINLVETTSVDETSQGLVITSVNAPNAEANGININGINSRADANGIVVNNVVCTSGNACGLQIGANITGASPVQQFGIFQSGNIPNVLSGETTIGTATLPSVGTALTMGGNLLEKVQDITTTPATIDINGGNIINCFLGSATLNLPASPFNGTRFLILKSTGTLSIGGNGNLINGVVGPVSYGGSFRFIQYCFITGVGWFATG